MNCCAICKGNSDMEFLRALLAETLLLCDLILLADCDDNANNNIEKREKRKSERSKHFPRHFLGLFTFDQAFPAKRAHATSRGMAETRSGC